MSELFPKGKDGFIIVWSTKPNNYLRTILNLQKTLPYNMVKCGNLIHSCKKTNNFKTEIGDLEVIDNENKFYIQPFEEAQDSHIHLQQ